jgi:hypothetical protein
MNPSIHKKIKTKLAMKFSYKTEKRETTQAPIAVQIHALRSKQLSNQDDIISSRSWFK